MKRRRILIAIAAMAVAGMVTMASAGVITATTSQQSVAYTVSNTDLINGLTGVVTGTPLNDSWGPDKAGTDGSLLTNGSFGAAFPFPSETVGITGSDATPTVITYTLPNSAFGYDITGINTYSGWQDDGRAKQKYDVYYALNATPSTFVFLTSVPLTTIESSTSIISVKVAITDSTGTVATGVGAIQFRFGLQQNNGVGYKELDVLGTAGVPEPASFSLLALGGLALLRRRR